MVTDSHSGDVSSNADSPNTKVVFDDAQQAKVDELIRAAQGRAARQTRQELSEVQAKLMQVQEELESTRQQRARKDPPAELEELHHAVKQKDSEIEKYRKLVADREREATDAKGKALDLQKQGAITSAANKAANFIDIDMVAEVTAKFVKYDEDRSKFIPVDEDGHERLNSSYAPMTLQEFYQEVANKRPYLVRSDAKGGAGSSESQRSSLSNIGKYTPEQIFGKNSNGALANKLAKEDMKEYQRLRHQAIEQGLI